MPYYNGKPVSYEEYALLKEKEKVKYFKQIAGLKKGGTAVEKDDSKQLPSGRKE